MKKNLLTAAILLCACAVILASAILMTRGAWWLSPESPPIPVSPAPPAPGPSAPVTITEQPDEVVRAPIEAPAQPQPAQPDPPGLVIAGIVTTDAEPPAAGAIVAAYTADTGAIRATAGDDGRFRVVGLRRGSYRVSAALDHYNEAVVEGIQAGASNVALVLQRLSFVEGKVLDGQGKRPLAQFSVLYLKAPPGDDRHWQNIIRGETAKWVSVNNEEGRYRMEDVLSDSEFAVAASAEGFEPAYAVVPAIKPGETGQAPDITLLPEAKILGRVVSGQDQPLSGADIFFGEEARGRNIARSNPDGRFTIGQLPPGPVTLTATHPDHLPATAQATLTRGKETEVEIVLGGGGSIQGAVLDGATPLSGQTIMASRLKPPRVRKDAITDDAGAYTIEGLPPGDVEVIAKLVRPGERDAGPVRLQKQAVIEDAQTTVVDFQLADASSAVEGSVSVAGEPPAVAMIQGYVAGDSGDTFFSTSTLSDGTYSIRNLPAGEAWLEISITLQDGNQRRKNIPIQIPPGQTVRQDIQLDASAAVYGTVSTLAPNEGGEVMAVMGPYNFNPAQIDIDELERIEVSTSPISPEGAYRLTGLDPGTYTIIVVAFDPDETDLTGQMPAIRSTSKTVTMAAGQELQLDLVIS